MANLLSQVVTTLVQLVTLPTLVTIWGTKGFGTWVLISSVSSYISLSDLGFSQAAAVEMTVAVSRGDLNRAKGLQQSLLALMMIVCAIIFLISAVTISVIAQSAKSDAAFSGDGAIRLALLFVVGATLFSLCTSGVGASLTANGKYAYGILFNSAVRLTEALAVIAGAVSGGGLVAAAALSMATRGVAFFLGLILATRLIPWFSINIREARLDVILNLWNKAAAVMTVPLGFAFGLQGITLAVGSALGVQAVSSFTAVRTLSRLTIQLALIVSNSVMPELGRAYGAGNKQMFFRLLKINRISAFVISLGMTSLLAIFGQRLVIAWTKGRIDPSEVFVAIMACGAGFQAYWLSAANMLIGLNRQSTFAYAFLLLMIVEVTLSYLMARGGLADISIVILVGEVVMLGWILSRVNKLQKEAFL